MAPTIKKITLTTQELNTNISVNGFVFLPSSKEVKTMALFTHGYTSHKSSVINWCMRLSEAGVACIVFDLPGHYLGTFSELESFDDFEKCAPNLFLRAYECLAEQLAGQQLSEWNLVLGGHSLGALLALKASTLEGLNANKSQHIVCVGFGLPPRGLTHVFDTPFYKATLDMRRQLVSPAINPDIMFPWIKDQKEQVKLTGKHIVLITGKDDVVVGKTGTELLAEYLKEQGNEITLEKPNSLGHHLPENAASHIKKALKDLALLS